MLGCGGDRDAIKRPAMGRIAAENSDHLVVTDDNPRTEDPAVIRAAVLAMGAREVAAGNVREVGDRGRTIATVVAAAQPGDTVMILGRVMRPVRRSPAPSTRSTTGWSLASVGAQTMIAMTLAQAATAMSGDLRDATDDIVPGHGRHRFARGRAGCPVHRGGGGPTTVTITSPRHWVQGVAAVVSRPVPVAHPGRRHRCRSRPSGTAVIDRCEDLQVVALTGSSGKTSTKDLLKVVLSAATPTVAPQRGRSTTNWACPAPSSGHLGHPLPGRRNGRPWNGHRLFVPSRRRMWPWPSTSKGRPTSASSEVATASPRRSRRSSPLWAPTGLPCSTPTIPGSWGMAAKAPGRIITFGQSAGADVGSYRAGSR